MQHKLPLYGRRDWEQHHVEQFMALLQRKNIPIQNYGLPLWEIGDTSIYLHDILASQDMHMPEEIVIDGHTYVRKGRNKELEKKGI